MSLGYEYCQVGSCEKTGKPYLSPISWFGQGRGSGGKSIIELDCPIYSTCGACCPERLTSEFLERRSNRKLKERNKKLGNVADKVEARWQKWLPQE